MIWGVVFVDERRVQAAAAAVCALLICLGHSRSSFFMHCVLAGAPVEGRGGEQAVAALLFVKLAA